MTTFHAGLNNPDLIFLLGKTLPTFMTDLLFKDQMYMNGEDALTAKGLKENGRRKNLVILRVRRRIVKTHVRRLRSTRVVLTPRRRR